MVSRGTSTKRPVLMPFWPAARRALLEASLIRRPLGWAPPHVDGALPPRGERQWSVVLRECLFWARDQLILEIEYRKMKMSSRAGFFKMLHLFHPSFQTKALHQMKSASKQRDNVEHFALRYLLTSNEEQNEELWFFKGPSFRDQMKGETNEAF